jgi:hypothetical protein
MQNTYVEFLSHAPDAEFPPSSHYRSFSASSAADAGRRDPDDLAGAAMLSMYSRVWTLTVIFRMISSLLHL